MNYWELKNKLKDLMVFSQKDLRKIEPKFNRFNLSEWQKKNYIKKIVKGYYIFSDLEISEHVLFIIANKIYKPSYISFEMALSYYRLIPESIYGITSATTQHSYKFKTDFAPFMYRKIKPKLNFGYKLVEYNKHIYKIAEIEKALIDFFYIRSDIKQNEDFEELRINKSSFLEQVDFEKLNKYLKIINSDVLSRRVRRFIRFIKNA
jgi:predicted transcriptional regulator of viral defense system